MMFRTTTAALMMLVMNSLVCASPIAQRLFTAADVFSLRHAGEIRISPDGHWIAYERSTADIAIDGDHHDVMLIDASSGAERRLAADATMPRWSRDGGRIAYIKASKSGGASIIVATPSGPDRQRVADLQSGPTSLEWSPDGSRIAFTQFMTVPLPQYRSVVEKPAGAQWASSPRIITGATYQQDGQHAATPGQTSLFVVPSGGGTTLRLTDTTTDVDGSPAWTPNGRAILYSAQPQDFRQHLYTNARIFEISVSGGTAVAISPKGIGARSPSVARDGSIAFVGSKPNGRDYSPGALYLMRRGGGEVHELAPRFDREIAAPVFTADGRSVLAAHGDRGKTVITRFALDGTSRTVVTAMGGDGAFSVADDCRIAYPSGDFQRPADVALATPGGAPRRLTSLNETLLADRVLATVRPFSFRSNLDGTEVGAWIVLPPRAALGRLPLVLSIHGGPYGYDDPSWNTEDQLFAAAGYAVLHVNYRGSISYGFAFADRIARDYPNPSYVDLMSGVDAAVAGGLADPERLFVTGGSAGGTLAAWIVGSNRRFRAAAVVKPSINEVSDALLTDQYAAADAAVGAFPWERPLDFWSRSPLSRVGNVVTPTLLMVGEEDHRTPAEEAQQFFNALQLRRVASKLVMFPDAGHDTLFATPSRLIAGVALRLEWFAQHDKASMPPPRQARPPLGI